MRRAWLVIALATVASSCGHVKPASSEGVPPPWPAARPEAGTVQPSATPPSIATPPSSPAQPGPGGSIMKKGTPPPIVPLAARVSDNPPSLPEIRDSFDRSQPPAPGKPPQLNLPTPVRRKLANGASLLVVERHQLPLLSMVITWPTGIADEPTGQAGLAALTADLLDEGAGSRGPLELAEAVARLGAHLDTGASWDATSVSTTTLTRALDPLLPIIADVVARPRFDDKELERVRADRLTAILQRHDTPAVLAVENASRVLYGETHRYGLPEIGTAATLKTLGRADVTRWHRERLRPDLATIIVVGDVTPDDLVRRLDAALAAWKATARPAIKRPPPPVATPGRRVVLVDRPGAAQTELYVGLPGAPRKSKDFFACQLLNSVLGGMFNSRLNINLREKHGYAYGAHSGFSFRRHGGPFLAWSSVKTAVTDASLKEVLAELARVRESNVTPAELRLAKDLLTRALARDFETPPQVASTLVAQVVEDLPNDYYKTYAANIEKVTIADVRRAAARWVDAANASIVLVGDEAQVGTAVKTLVGAYERRGSDGTPLAAAPAPATTAPATPAPATAAPTTTAPAAAAKP